MNRRFYCPQLVPNAQITLSGEEAHHLAQVLRAAAGTSVQVFDGKGHEASAVVVECGRRTAVLEVGAVESISRESPIELTVASAIPRTGRERFLVEKLVELGAARLWVYKARRSVARPSSGFLTKAQRIVVEASKQCGRNILMPVEAKSFAEIVTGSPPHVKRYLAHPGGESVSAVVASARVAVLIGPEGGFVDSELRQAEAHGWQRISLGPRVLRIETAAMALAGRFLLANQHPA